MTDGFFSEEQIELPLDLETRDSPDCLRCKLYRNCGSPKMPTTGEGRKGVLFIGEAPGQTEDERNVQFIGEAGQLLRKELRKLDVDLDKDCWKVNSINCRPPKNRTPTASEIGYCRPLVFKAIKKHKPRVIIPVGNSALSSILGHRWKGGGEPLGGITRWRGWVIPDRDLKAYVCPTFHPSFLLRVNDPIHNMIFRQDLERAFGLQHAPPEKGPDEVEVVKDFPTIARFLKGLLDDPKTIAFDYETTGIRYRQGHRILCCSICDSKTHVMSFPMLPSVKPILKQVLERKDIGKIAHNLSFEDTWSRSCLDARVAGWEFDTQIGAHIVDNREDTKSLKFWVYVSEGVVDYSSALRKYMKSGKDGFNTLERADVDTMLRYCGLDSLYSFRLAIKQRRKIERMSA